jgi:hypothetical protein
LRPPPPPPPGNELPPCTPCPRRDLIAEHDQRAANHAALLAALKGINQAIQAASRLRVGPPKARLVAAARAAVKAADMRALARVLRGNEAPLQVSA